jgi:SAM-dependent methyltransferase
MDRQDLIRRVADYYTARIMEHGPVPRGVDWSSAESQQIRFEQLVRLCDSGKHFSINDYGCGYGMLARFLETRGDDFTYVGFDISPVMISHANRALATKPNCAVVDKPGQLSVADYTIASGIFNVKLDAGDEEWTAYVVNTLDHMRELSSLGFGFNLLTRHCDPHLMRRDLHYGDPGFYVSHCLSRFSRRVSLLHDYPLYEFTVLVWLK